MMRSGKTKREGAAGHVLCGVTGCVRRVTLMMINVFGSFGESFLLLLLAVCLERAFG